MGFAEHFGPSLSYKLPEKPVVVVDIVLVVRLLLSSEPSVQSSVPSFSQSFGTQGPVTPLCLETPARHWNSSFLHIPFLVPKVMVKY